MAGNIPTNIRITWIPGSLAQATQMAHSLYELSISLKTRDPGPLGLWSEVQELGHRIDEGGPPGPDGSFYLTLPYNMTEDFIFAAAGKPYLDPLVAAFEKGIVDFHKKWLA